MKNIFFILLFLSTFQLNAQMRYISGRIVDIKNDNSISSCSIIEDNSKIGTISNVDGTFSIHLNTNKVILIFEHQNYETFSYTFTLKGDTVFKIKLIPKELENKIKKLERREEPK